MKEMYLIFVRFSNEDAYHATTVFLENEEEALEWAKRKFKDATYIMVCELKASWAPHFDV